MTDGVLGPRWVELERRIEEELAAWRREHPRASLTEIELAVEAVTARVQATLIAALAGEEAAGEVDDQPACPACGVRLRRRGRRTRQVLVPHQGQALPLERDYLVCPACGAGLSPPG